MVSFKMIDIVDVASDQMEPSKRVSLKEEEPANLVTSLREKLDSLSLYPLRVESTGFLV